MYPTASPLQICRRADSALLTPAQKRFNSLLKQIGTARRTLAEWQAQITRYRQAHAQVMAPLQSAYAQGQRAWVIALDAAFDWPGWSRAERDTFSALVRHASGELLDEDDSDATVRALFGKHSEIDYETDKQQALKARMQMAEAVTGLDLGDADELRSDEDLMQRLQQGLAAAAERRAQAEAEQAEQAARRPPRRASAAQQRREAESQRATQSLREIYRKLASALHPDREPDASQRASKTALMQRANQAYAANDLLGLLSLQLEIEQVDATHLARASAEQLKHYNRVLAEQLDDLKHEIDQTEMAFCASAGLLPDRSLTPSQLLRLIDSDARSLRASLARQKQERELLELADRAKLKRWLKRERLALQQPGFGDGWF